MRCRVKPHNYMRKYVPSLKSLYGSQSICQLTPLPPGTYSYWTRFLQARAVAIVGKIKLRRVFLISATPLLYTVKSAKRLPK